MTVSGMVFHIQRFSLHDGPGIRTTVFMQGCALECFWCHNPEGRSARPLLRFFPDRCIACGACAAACPSHAHAIHDGVHTLSRALCRGNGACVAACFAGALQMTGRLMTVDDVMREVRADRPFYESSGGGLTLSGGEPSLQRSFARALLAGCREAGIRTALQTCGQSPWRSLAPLVDLADLVMMDIKLIDSARHRSATGKGNEQILANARRIARTGADVIFRTPVVPGVNDTPEEIAGIAAFIGGLAAVRRSAIRYELMPFHGLARDKYASLGLDYPASALVSPRREAMLALLDAARFPGVAPSIS
ncbi:MAG TPA: glycyl-radical enzyme activating protein [Bacteroidota bacterium]|nr:glycyl-radical enzyme activating protein [Bacteroidota bacterium]